jgi:hypothetical protein
VPTFHPDPVGGYLAALTVVRRSFRRHRAPKAHKAHKAKALLTRKIHPDLSCFPLVPVNAQFSEYKPNGYAQRGHKARRGRVVSVWPA